MGLREEISKDFPDRATFNAAVTDGVEAELNPVKADVQTLQTEQAAQKVTLTTLGTQVAGIAAAVAGITSALSVLGAAVKKAQAAADKAQATADSKPGGEGSGGYGINVKWIAASGSNITGPFKVSITSQGRSISKTITTEQSASLAGLSSGSVVTLGIDVGSDNTVQWQDTTQDNPNLTGRSNFYKEYSGFKVPATTGIKTIIASIG